jgi:YidC/Oxa1 family membrane protein insertase
MNLPIALLPPIKLIVETLKPILVFIHDSIGVSWGFSIVLMTMMVRGAMAPLTVKQFKSMQAMVRVAPQLKELQAKYKDDKQRQQQEVMKFYAENKINPFASCLPLVAQLPFFIGLFYLLQTDLRFEICGQTAKPCGQVPGSDGSESFLFIPDLTDKATGAVLVVLIILYIGSQLLSSLLTPSTADRNQRMLMYGLPFVFTFFIINFPAGLIVYWITTNLWTVGQGYLIRRNMGPIAPPKFNDDGSERAPTSPISSLVARLRGEASPPASNGGKKAAPRAPKAPKPAKAAAAADGATTPTAKSKSKSGAAAGATAEKEKSKVAPSGPPPPPPRQKKKRSGRRR